MPVTHAGRERGMTMEFTFTVTVSVTRESGKFASRDEIADQIIEAIEEANPEEISGIGSDGESTYTVDEWMAEEYVKPKAAKRAIRSAL